MVDGVPGSVKLSAQEQRVAEALARGDTNKAIARELGISIKTVEFHLHNIYAKIGTTSRVHLAGIVGEARNRPTGTVTFLFTDIEGSTMLWDRSPRAMAEVISRHDELVRGAIEANGGYVFATGGDGFAAAFTTADGALDAALAVQDALAREPWSEIQPRVRVGLHTGTAEERWGDYFGASVHRAARITDMARGSQIVLSAPTALLASEERTFEDLGTHRLNGFDRPEHLLRLHVGGGADIDRPLRTSARGSGNLPNQRGEMVGRDGELAVLDALLRHRSLVSVVGVGGVGKTRLAVAAAGSAADQFPDGVWFVELAEVVRDGDVVGPVAVALDLEPRAATRSTALTAALGGQRRLVVLDSCEHLLHEAGDLVAAIHTTCPNVTILATTRQALGVEGEHVLPVPPLALQINDGGSDAATLFCQRATGALGRFTPTSDEHDQVETIVQRLDGLPLAIELAASRLTSLTLDQLQEQLGDPLAVLTHPDAALRHQSLRATITCSYDLLDPDLQVLFDRLSVFAGDVDVTMAEAVLGSGPSRHSVEAGLALLVDHSLLTVRRARMPTRYVMLDTLRQFGAEQLEARGESDIVRRRYLDHVVAWTERAHEGVCSADELLWHRAIVERWHHLRGAVDLACQWDDGDAACRLVTALLYWAATRLRAEVGAWSEAVLALPSAADHPLRSAVAIGCSTFAHLRLDPVVRDERSALAFAEEARLGRAHEPLVPLVAGVGEPDMARVRALAEEVQRRSDAIGSSFWHLSGVMQVLLMDGREVGAAVSRRDERRRLVARAHEALATAEQIGAPNHIAFASLTLGMALRRDEPGLAVPVLERANDLATAVDNRLAAYQIRAELALAYVVVDRPLDTVELLAGPLRRSYLAGAWTEVWWAVVPMTGALARLGREDVAAIILSLLVDQAETRLAFDVDATEAELRGRIGPAELERLMASPRGREPNELVALVLEAADAILA